MNEDKVVIQTLANKKGQDLLKRLYRGQKLINVLALVAFALVLLWIFGVF